MTYQKENIGENLCDPGLGKALLVKTQKPRTIKERNYEVDFTKIKFFCSEKVWRTILRECKATEWENAFVKYISDKELVHRICKEWLQFENKNNI